MTDTSSPSTSTSAATAPVSAAVGSDELSKLHKMSRTAGLGDSTYVAVNALAVATFVFGLASAIVIFGAVFLLVPAVAIILGVLAFLQIRDSNGTQTGRLLAGAGIVLAIGFSAALGSRYIAQIYATREDEQAISSAADAFGKDLSERKYDDAYKFLSDRLAGDTSRTAFEARLDLMQNSPGYGKIKSVQWNGLAQFDIDSKTANRIADTFVLINLESGAVDREATRFVQQGGKWVIDAIPNLLPPPAPPAAPELAPGKPVPSRRPTRSQPTG